MKKISLILLAAALVLSLSGCVDDTSKSSIREDSERDEATVMDGQKEKVLENAEKGSGSAANTAPVPALDTPPASNSNSAAAAAPAPNSNSAAVPAPAPASTVELN